MFHLTLIDFNVSVHTKLSTVEGNYGIKEWSAPETRSKSSYTEISDMWSFGCVLFFMYSRGQNLFEEGYKLGISNVEESV